jgi:hypothetical protein
MSAAKTGAEIRLATRNNGKQRNPQCLPIRLSRGCPHCQPMRESTRAAREGLANHSRAKDRGLTVGRASLAKSLKPARLLPFCSGNGRANGIACEKSKNERHACHDGDLGDFHVAVRAADQFERCSDRVPPFKFWMRTPKLFSALRTSSRSFLRSR